MKSPRGSHIRSLPCQTDGKYATDPVDGVLSASLQEAIQGSLPD